MTPPIFQSTRAGVRVTDDLGRVLGTSAGQGSSDDHLARLGYVADGTEPSGVRAATPPAPKAAPRARTAPARKAAPRKAAK